MSRSCLMAGLALWVAACGGAQTNEGRIPPADPIDDVEPAVLFQQGEQAARNGDLIRAEQYMSAALGRGYSEELGMPSLVRVCVAASRMRAALSYATPFLERHPSNWPLRYLVASIELGLGHPDRARDELLRVLATAPDQPNPHYLLAIILTDNMRDAEAGRPHFERYLALTPTGEHAEEVRARLVPMIDAGAPTRTMEALGASSVSSVDGGSL